VALIGIGIGLAAGPGVAAAAPTDSADTTASADAARTDTSTDTGSAHAAPDAEPASRHTEPTDTEPADTENLTETGSRVTSTAGGRHRRAARHAEARADKADAPAAPERPASEPPEAPESATPAAAPTTEAVTVDTPPERPTLRSVASARPVTVKSIATDVLTWSGLRPLPDGLPLPSAPVSALVQSLWLGVRQSQYTLHNQRPTAAPTTSGPGPDGTLRGSLNATDYDDASLTYTVSSAGAYGTVSINADGGFV
jgi:hypothetical protein